MDRLYPFVLVERGRPKESAPWQRHDKLPSHSEERRSHMRMLVVFLFVVGAVYVWDLNYDNGALSDGVRNMWASIAHGFGY